SPRSPEQWKGDRRADRLFRSMILCNNARLRSGPKASENFVDNPTERALLEGAEAAGRNVGRVRREFPRIEEFPFDPTSRRMAVLCRSLSGWELHVKGAPESVLVMCSGWWDGRRIRPLDEHLRRRW